MLRLGTKKKEQVWPVLIKFRSATAAYGLLKKSRDLRKVDKFCRVYISSDRTRAQRIERLELVNRMKEKASQDSSRRYFILDDQIECEERGSGKSKEEET